MSVRRQKTSLLVLILFVAFAHSSFAGEEFNMLPATSTGKGNGSLPECGLKKGDVEFVITVGKNEVTRIRHSEGKNIQEPKARGELALFTALKTLSSLREAKVCR